MNHDRTSVKLLSRKEVTFMTLLTSSLAGQFIFLCFGIFFLFLLVSAFFTKRTIVGGGQSWRMTVLIIALVAFVLSPRIRNPLDASRVLWPQTLAVGIIADMVSLLGLIVVLWARVTLGGNWSAWVVLKENHELIERGPYAYVRHPMYYGSLLMMLGWAILYGRVTGFALWIICFFGLWFKARHEERLLTKHSPEAYPRYKARTKA